jgi:hypothetical protein
VWNSHCGIQGFNLSIPCTKGYEVYCMQVSLAPFNGFSLRTPCSPWWAGSKKFCFPATCSATCSGTYGVLRTIHTKPSTPSSCMYSTPVHTCPRPPSHHSYPNPTFVFDTNFVTNSFLIRSNLANIVAVHLIRAFHAITAVHESNITPQGQKSSKQKLGRAW